MNITSLKKAATACVTLLALGLPALASAAQTTITMTNSTFSPPTVNINQGDSVLWSNTSSIPHTVTLDTITNATVTLQPGQTYSYTFTAQGSFPYHCDFHGGTNGAGMSGVVTVGAQQGTIGTSAAGNSQQIQAQTQALLAQVQALQAQLGGQGGAVNTGASAGVGTGAASCPNIGRVLKLGSKGDDVLRLQQYLALDPAVYPEGTASGYFGALTQAAVKRWQVKYNIVSSGTAATTGFGVVGPRTAAAIALLCSTGGAGGGTGASVGTPTVGGYIQVTPISGNAPLAVTVIATVNTVNSCAAATYVLNWGDNTAPIQIPVASNNCSQAAQTFQHTFTNPGSYSVTLTAGVHQTSAVITVGGGSTPTTPSNPPPQNTNTGSLQAPTVTPNVGGNPLAVTVGFDLGACMGYSMNWGDSTPTVATAATCTTGGSASSQSLSHTYSVAGTYTITLTRGARTDTVGVAITN